MNKNCPQCGTQVHNELPGGLCPACLMAAAQQSLGEQQQSQANQNTPGLKTPTLDKIATAFPELEVIQFIGRGGMGAVYQVRQKNLDRVVALKVFLYRPDDPEFAARFQREARALAKLNHPNIVTVHDFGERQGMHYLLMEFIDGLNLRELTHEEKLSPEMALELVPQLCDALQYAHDNGVIHRDIKPENLLLDTNGRINIADFGLAKMTGNQFNGTLTHTQQVMGTYNYMAPEQRERPTEVDHRADIYSLGVVIYELLTGELPIGRFQPPSSKSKVNTRLDEVVMRALEKEPERRYQQANEFKTGFQSVHQHHGESQPAGHQANYGAAGAVGFHGGHGSPAHAAPQPPVKAGLSPDRAPVGTRCMLTLMAGREKKGNWQPGSPQLAFTMMGGTCLDLTQVKSRDVNLTVFTLMGGTEIIVPHGASVDLDGFILMGATEDNVRRNDGQSNMQVRIRSWGAMGACEVRTPKLPPNIKDVRKMENYRTPPDHQISFANGLIQAFKFFAMLVTLSVPVLFMLGGFDIVDENESKMLGIVAAISAGMLWGQVNFLRRLIGAGPESDDEETVANYYSSSRLGTAVRMVALVFVFGCPILFVLANFMRHDREELRFAAIITAIIGGALFVAAGYLEDFLFGKRKE